MIWASYDTTEFPEPFFKAPSKVDDAAVHRGLDMDNGLDMDTVRIMLSSVSLPMPELLAMGFHQKKND